MLLQYSETKEWPLQSCPVLVNEKNWKEAWNLIELAFFPPGFVTYSVFKGNLEGTNP